MTLSLVFVAGFVVSALLALVVRRVAMTYGAVVPPRSDRWHHDATPTFGGIAIDGDHHVAAGGEDDLVV